MSLINEMTPVIPVPSLDLFSSAPVQNSILSTRPQEVRPISLLNTGNHVDFIINNGINEYMRLDLTTLYVKFRVILSSTDGAEIATSDWGKITPCNNFLNNLWSQVDLSIGDAQTTLSLQTYPYRSYFEWLLNSSQQANSTYLSQCGYSKDVMSAPDAQVGTRQDLIKYIKATGATKDSDIQKGREYEMEGPLSLDIFQQPKAIVGGATIKIKLVPNKPEFIFLVDGDKIKAKIEFSDIYLNVFKSIVSSEIISAHASALNISPAKMIISRNEVRSYLIGSGLLSKNLENVFHGTLPSKLYVAFVNNEAFNGNYKKNPYYFDHFDISSIGCFINGEPYPIRAYTPDFANDIYLREYFGLIRATKQLNNNIKTFITKENFKTGYTIFAFDFTPDLSDGYYSSGHINLPKQGVLRIEIKFAKATPKIINALVYSKFDNLINILENRNAITDYH